MAGMLPGVELARRRRTNHHYYSPREPSLHLHLEPSSAMGETALRARKKLEEKLGFNNPISDGKLPNEDAVCNDVPVLVRKLQKFWSSKSPRGIRELPLPRRC